jgi:hypothetical protein
MIQNHNKYSIFQIITLTLVAIGIGFLGYLSWTLISQGQNAQSLMKKSKTVKQAYGQSAQSRKESQARDDFDDLYNKYIDDKHHTLKRLDQDVKKADLAKINRLANQTGIYYKDEYQNRAKMFTLIANTQNDYLQLFKGNKIGQAFKAKVRPADIYSFNDNHYADMQTIMAIDSTSTYPSWAIGEMQKMGADASKVERFLKDFNTDFSFPSKNDAWRVKHSYLQADVQSLTDEVNSLAYDWDFIQYPKNIVQISSATALYNSGMQGKVDDANRQIQAIKDQVKKDQDQAKQKKQAEEDAKKAADSASKSSSDANLASSNTNTQSNGQNGSTGLSGGNGVISIPSFIGKNVSEAVKWANDQKQQVMKATVQANQASGTIVQQEWHDNALYVQVAQ